MAETFQDTKSDYEHLRKCIEALHEIGMTSQKLLDAVKSNTHRTSLDRFRNSLTNHIAPELASSLWDHIRDAHPIIFQSPQLLQESSESEDILFAYLRHYFALKSPRIQGFAQDFVNDYVCYTRSELFFSQERVTVSTFNIDQKKSGRLRMEDTHEYRLTGSDASLSEKYVGVCMPKTTSKIFLAHDTANRRPRIYFVNKHMTTGVGKQRKCVYFRGFVVSNSAEHEGYFQANFFCRRLKIGEKVNKTIIERKALEEDMVDDWLFKGS